MLGTEQRGQRDLGIRGEAVGGVAQVCVHRSGIAHQADPLAGDQPAIGRQQTVDAGADDLTSDRGR